MFKAAKVPFKSAHAEVILQTCSEVLEGAAVLEALVRSACNPLLAENTSVLDLPKQERYLREWAILRGLRRHLMLAELRLDASLTKLGAILGSAPPVLSCLEGHFLRTLDRGISDHSDSQNPDSSEATRVFSTNYLIEEDRFPFGDLFKEEDAKSLFGKMRGEIEAIIKGLFR